MKFVTLAISLCVLSACAPVSPPRGTLRIGDSPGFEEEDLKGQPFSLKAHAGKVVLLDFWATWCGPCRAELPNVKRFAETHKDDVVVMSISADEDVSLVRRYIADNDIFWPQFGDGRGWRNRLIRHFGVRGVPVLVVIGRDGRVRAVDNHFSGVARELLEAIKEKPAQATAN